MSTNLKRKRKALEDSDDDADDALSTQRQPKINQFFSSSLSSGDFGRNVNIQHEIENDNSNIDRNIDSSDDESIDSNKPDIYLSRLLKKQELILEKIKKRLTKQRRKTGHWIWWVFPTTKEGASEPTPSTKLSNLQQVKHLIDLAPSEWREVLELLADLIDEKNDLEFVIPTIDHKRIGYFIRLFRKLPKNETPLWLITVLTRFERFME